MATAGPVAFNSELNGFAARPLSEGGEPKRAQRLEGPFAAPASRHKTVVIADDSVVARGLFARWLGESGQFHVVAVAGDGETAVAHATRFQPDLMVLDLNMPGVDGATAGGWRIRSAAASCCSRATGRAVRSSSTWSLR